MRVGWCTIVIALAGVAGGCHRPDAGREPVTRTVFTPDAGGATRLFDAAEWTLRRQGYRIDRLDRRARVVTTFPEASQQFFEVWRHDVDTAYDWLDASINPVRRRVEVRVEPGPPEHAATVTVLVLKQRRSMPDRQFNDAGTAYQFFGYSLPATTGQARITPEDERWIDQGHDPAMERYLLQKILRRAGLKTAPAGADAADVPDVADVPDATPTVPAASPRPDGTS